MAVDLSKIFNVFSLVNNTMKASSVVILIKAENKLNSIRASSKTSQISSNNDIINNIKADER